MPTYDYRCNACGHQFELFQSMTAPVQRKCPACGRLRLERLIGTGAGVIFKGGGFYETDYRSDAYSKAAEAEKKAAEAKPAESTAAAPAESGTAAKDTAPKADPKTGGVTAGEPPARPGAAQPRPSSSPGKGGAGDMTARRASTRRGAKPSPPRGPKR